MDRQRFCYGLQNGMVGVYLKKKRLWAAKSQIKPVGVFQSFFEKEEGYTPIVIGRENGTIELRHDSTGEIIYKVSLPDKLSSILYVDLRMDGNKQIVAIASEGFIRGYLLSPQKETALQGSSNVAKGELQQELEELQKKKNILQLKAQSLEYGNNKLQSSINPQQQLISTEQEQLLPPATKFQHGFQHNLPGKSVDLIVQTQQGVYLKCAILFNDKLFEQESYFYSPVKPSNSIQIPLKPQQNSTEKIRCKVIAGTNPHAQYFQVVEIEPQLPRFANYLCVALDAENRAFVQPSSTLFLKINERIPRYIKWLDQSFIVQPGVLAALESQAATFLSVKFTHIQTNLSLAIEMDQSKGVVQIRTDSIELAGDIVQDLCQYLNIQELESVGEFPVELEKFKHTLNQVESFRHSKMQITSEIADSINNIKTLIVKAEDSKVLGEMNYVRKFYTEVMGENTHLFAELTKQQQNTGILMDGLREVNAMINKAANLRNGQYKTQVINLCRQAIKQNNLI